MTAEERGFDLIHKAIPLAESTDDYGKITGAENWKNAVQLALIMVGQIQLEISKGSEFKKPLYQDERWNYWQEVKDFLLTKVNGL